MVWKSLNRRGNSFFTLRNSLGHVCKFSGPPSSSWTSPEAKPRNVILGLASGTTPVGPKLAGPIRRVPVTRRWSWCTLPRRRMTHTETPQIALMTSKLLLTPDTPASSRAAVPPSVWREVWRLIRPYVPRVMAAMLFGLIFSGLNGVIAWLVKPVIDRIFIEQRYEHIYFLPAGVVVLYILRGVANFLHSYLMKTAGMKLVRDQRNRFFSHLLQLPVSVMARTRTGDVLSRLMNDLSALSNILSECLQSLLLDLPTVIVLLSVAFYRRWELTLLSVTLLPFIALGTRVLSRLVRKRRKAVQRYLALLTHRATEALQGLKVVKVFCMEEKKSKQFTKENHAVYRQMSQVIRLREGTKFLIESLSGLAVAIIVGYGTTLVARGEMTSGDFFSVLTAIVMAFSPLKKVGGAYSQFQEILGVLERIDSFKERTPENRKGEPAQSLKNAICYEGVSFSYPGTERTVLKDINLSIPHGKILAIVGPSGAGKSSLVDLLPRFYEPTGGRILWDGQDIQGLRLEDLRRQIAIVTQDVILFSDTIDENIVAGRPGATRGEAEKAARLAQAHDFIVALPDDYDTMLGERGLNLSGGQRQRIALARAIIHNPPLLILDEATSALDSVSEKAIQEALEKVMKGRTTIVIAHRLSTILHADQIVVLDQGKIVDQGTHESLMASNPLYKELYQTWTNSEAVEA